MSSAAQRFRALTVVTADWRVLARFFGYGRERRRADADQKGERQMDLPRDRQRRTRPPATAITVATAIERNLQALRYF